MYIYTQTFIEVDNLTVSANTTATVVWDALMSRTSLIRDINSTYFNNQGQLEVLNSSIDNLQSQLERALQAAASVSVEDGFHVIKESHSSCMSHRS